MVLTCKTWHQYHGNMFVKSKLVLTSEIIILCQKKKTQRNTDKKQEVWKWFWFMVFNATFNNISVISSLDRRTCKFLLIKSSFSSGLETDPFWAILILVMIKYFYTEKEMKKTEHKTKYQQVSQPNGKLKRTCPKSLLTRK